MTQIQYLSKEKYDELKQELFVLKREKMPALARRIDEARQMGDLSENAEYHAAREDMSWSKSRVEQIQSILDNSEIISPTNADISEEANLGSTVLFKIDDEKENKEFTIVGSQESDPKMGRISNESPIGEALLGARKGQTIELVSPSGIKKYKIIDIK